MEFIQRQLVIPLLTELLGQVALIERRRVVLEPLTQREQEVLHLLADGASNQDIANQLVVSLATAKKHVASILSKLGAENRTQAIARARSLSLL